MVEMIGFFISLLALIYLFFKKPEEDPRKGPQPTVVGEEDLFEDDPLKEFLKSLEPKPVAPPKKPKPIVQAVWVPPPKAKSARLEERHLKSEIEQRKLRSSVEKVPLIAKEIQEPRAVQSLKRLSSLKEMVIYHEIFGKPKGF